MPSNPKEYAVFIEMGCRVVGVEEKQSREGACNEKRKRTAFGSLGMFGIALKNQNRLL
jgi:hypothetical protein